MLSTPAACLLAATLLACASARADGVAHVLDVEIDRSALAPAGNPRAQVMRLRDLVWEGVAGHHIAQAGLHATSEEIAEIAAYDREFRVKDRAQRSRKLAELNERLAGTGLTAGERTHLEEFRAVLVRLEQREAEEAAAASNAGDFPVDAARYRSQVERWKLDKELYERYGG